MLCSAHSFFRSLALGNALGLQMRSKILLEFPFFFELMIYLNNFESCVNCVWCTLRPSRTLIDPVSRLLSWCTAVSGSPDSSSRTGSQGTWEGERCEMLNPKRAVVNPAGHANRHTHTHHPLKSSCCHALSTTIWSFVYIEHILFFLFVALLLIGIWFQPATVTSVLCSN